MTDQQIAGETPERTRLRTHFLADRSQHNSKWNELWADNFIPWDKGTPSPALVDALSQRKDTLGSPITKDADGKVHRKRALVPGCGKGYDVLLLASFGYDAWGLEVSQLAHKACEEFKQEKGQGGEYNAVDEDIGRGSANFVLGDFYMQDWEKTAGGPFDIIYDYTFLCAMTPKVRPEWALRMSTLLAPDGHLICLEFPLYKEPSTGGPPHGLREEVYVEHLKRPGDKIPYDKDGFVVVEAGASPNSHALRRLARWKPEKTHKIGEGTDHMSIWSHQ